MRNDFFAHPKFRLEPLYLVLTSNFHTVKSQGVPSTSNTKRHMLIEQLQYFRELQYACDIYLFKHVGLRCYIDGPTKCLSKTFL